MDFFKSCTTNVYLIEELLQTRFRSYRLKADPTEELETWKQIQATLARLRELNVLCVADEDQGVCVFEEVGEEAGNILQAFDMIEENTLELELAKQRDRSSVKDGFLDAIEGALAFHLARDSCSVHVAPWTWVCYEEGDGEHEPSPSFIVKVLRKITPSGSLYLIPEVQETNWSPMDRQGLATGTEVILSPYGKPATIIDGFAKDMIAGEGWKDAVTVGMQARGLRIPEDSQWIAVQERSNFDSTTAFLWPEILCLVRHGLDKQDAVPFEDDSNWRRWFETADRNTSFRNPLAEAEEWFKSAREAERSGQDIIQVAEELTASSGNAVSYSAQGADVTTSPPFNQRLMDQQAALAGIYPTPPDGLTQGPPNGQHNSAATPSVIQGEPSAMSADNLPTSDEVHFQSFDHKPSVGAESFQMGAEDLFGDVGEMEIGENEVDDADFNFFDDDDDDAAPQAAPLDHQIMKQSNPQINPTPAAQAIDEGMQLPFSVAGHGDHDGLPATEIPPSSPVATKDQNTSDTLKDDMEGIFTAKSSAAEITEPEKPLSPFGIRERLLPPPVPASVAHSDSRQQSESRRSSRFGPINFRENMDLGPRYADTGVPKEDRRISSTMPNIGLPQSKKKSQSSKKSPRLGSLVSEQEDSDDESNLSSSSQSDTDIPPSTPWDMPDSRKRKRHGEQRTANVLADAPERIGSDSSLVATSPVQTSDQDMLDTINKLEISEQPLLAHPSQPMSRKAFPFKDRTKESLRSIVELHTLPKEDIICIAQIVSEQAITTLDSAVVEGSLLGLTPSIAASNSVSKSRRFITSALETVFPEFDMCDLATLALTREPLAPARSLTNSGKGGQPLPRPLQRADSLLSGPEIFCLPAPHVKIQRGKENWEMLPTSLAFWETLGLGPASGPKNVRAFCVFPDNDDLQHLVERFMVDMSTAYESCKLGTHVHHRNASAKDMMDNFEDGMAPVEVTEEVDIESALKSYASTCANLGKALSSISQGESNRSIVVYVVNPFTEQQATKHLCACFWLLWKAYRDNLPRAHRNQCNSDLVMQLLPINLFASFDMLVIPGAKRMAALAREVYDRCPPSPDAPSPDDTSPLRIMSAPSVELASSAPKRIAFQLSAEPPSDLLHEGSVLHVAYAISPDGEWLTSTWIDNTGRYQDSVSLCLRGGSFADVANDVWERTREIIAARKVTWRIFIVTHQGLDRSISLCWRSLAGKPRAQALCVTMLTVQVDPAMHLQPPAESQSSGGQDNALFTPVSTPQGNPNLISSPDVGQTPTANNAPPTPAPSETAASLAENDPDAHLVDATDETFALLYHPKFINLGYNTGLANGALFQWGSAEAALDTTLPSLGVSVHWTIQVKPDGKVDEGSPKQAELTLKDVMRMYRHLGLLTKARGLEKEGKASVPLHVEVARRGVEGLDGMLPPISGD